MSCRQSNGNRLEGLLPPIRLCSCLRRLFHLTKLSTRNGPGSRCHHCGRPVVIECRRSTTAIVVALTRPLGMGTDLR